MVSGSSTPPTSPIPQERALEKRSSGAITGYQPPRPGSSIGHTVNRAMLMGTSVALGAGVALSAFGVLPALGIAAVIAGMHVTFQAAKQNHWGHHVLNKITLGELEAAQKAAEEALRHAQPGGLTVLAGANLASVLLQRNRVSDGIYVLNRHRPRWPHVPIATALWLNNRAFAELITSGQLDDIDHWLSRAEQFLEKVDKNDVGGQEGYDLMHAAILSSRALQAVKLGQYDLAHSYIRHIEDIEHDHFPEYRVVEKELCRIAILVGEKRIDESVLAAAGMERLSMTPLQRKRFALLNQTISNQSDR